MVFVDTEAVGLPAEAAVSRLADLGVGAVPIGPAAIRMVTHVGVDDDGISLAIDAWASVAATTAKET
jgi:hypothetical protein